MEKYIPLAFVLVFTICLMGGLSSLVIGQDAAPLPTDAEIAQMQRDLRDACELRRAAAQEAGDDAERQYWLVQRRALDLAISARELRRATASPTTPPAIALGPAATLRADAEPGEVGELVYHNGEVYWVARVAPGDQLIAQSWHDDGGELLTDWLTDADRSGLTIAGDATLGSLPQPMRITRASIDTLPPGRHELQVWVLGDTTGMQTLWIEIEGESQ